MLRLDLRPGEGMEIDGGKAVVRMEHKSGQIARLAIEAGKEVKIRRLDSVPSPAQLAQKGMTRAA